MYCIKKTYLNKEYAVIYIINLIRTVTDWQMLLNGKNIVYFEISFATNKSKCKFSNVINRESWLFKRYTI